MLHIPDFRSPERTFQLITQAAGRAGRGDEVGRVIIQSYTPENYAVQRAAAQDYYGFYDEEIQLRQLMGYPPYSDLFQIVFAAKREADAKNGAQRWYEQLAGVMSEQDALNVFKPQPAPMNKIKETYRYCMLIKCPQGKRRLYAETLEIIKEKNKDKKNAYSVTVDINPYSFV
jgi:primosomal protein N' (replication factor Y)